MEEQSCGQAWVLRSGAVPCTELSGLCLACVPSVMLLGSSESPWDGPGQHPSGPGGAHLHGVAPQTRFHKQEESPKHFQERNEKVLKEWSPRLIRDHAGAFCDT